MREPSDFSWFAFEPQHTNDLGSIDEVDEAFDSHAEALLPQAKRPRIGYTCEDCQKTYKHERALARHRRSEEHCRRIGVPVPPRLLCPYPGCGKSFGRAYDRSRHEREMHHRLKRSQARSSTSANEVDISLPGPSSNRYIGLDSVQGDRHSTVEYSVSQHSICDNRQDDLPDSTTPDFEHNSATQKSNMGDFRTSLHMSDLATQIDVVKGQGDFYSVFGVPDEDRAIQPESISTPGVHTFPDASDESMDRVDPEDNLRRDSNEDSGVDLTYDGSSPTALTSKKSSEATELVKDSRFDLPIRTIHTRSTLIRMGANPRPNKEKGTPPCPLCHCSFGIELDDIREHMRRHMTDLQGEHVCAACSIGFRDRTDLKLHESWASKKKPHCGFNFEHNRPCTGHHRPDESDIGHEYSDRVKLWYFLKDWEQAVLQLFMDRVNEMLSGPSRKAQRDCWSVDAMLRRSIASISNLDNTFARKSAPDYIDYQSKLEIANVRQSMQGRLLGMDVPPYPRSVLETPLSSQWQIDRDFVEAVRCNDMKKVVRLIGAGANVNVQVLKRGGNHSFTSPLIEASLENNQNMIEMLAAKNADLNLRCFKAQYGTALCTAAATGKIAAVESLLAMGASANLIGSDKYGNPLYCAASSGSRRLCRMLLNHGARVDQYSGEHSCALNSAAYHIAPDVVDTLLHSGAYPGLTALCLAASNCGPPGSLEVVKLLLDHVADVNEGSVDKTALQLASRRRDYWQQRQPDDELSVDYIDACLERAESVVSFLSTAVRLHNPKDEHMPVTGQT